MAASAARIVLVGVSGYGKIHAERIERLAVAGQVELVAGVDPAFAAEPRVAYGAPVFDDLTEALQAVGSVDVVVIAAPIGHHFALADTALTSGADVYLEKPPVASIADFESLLATEEATGRVVQVGFQSLGSLAVARLAADAYGIGPVRQVGAVGAWARTVGYWKRSAWAGRRSLNGRPIVDGVLTNAMAHAVATALGVVGCRRSEDVEAVETDLYRANAIDADDTSVVRITTSAGLQVTCALTLSAAAQREPLIQIEGSTGRAVLSYTVDRVEVETADGTRTETTDRTDLLENLLAHRGVGTPLLVPLASTGAFMRVLDAVSAADEPLRIDPRAIEWSDEGLDRRAVVTGIEEWLDRAAGDGRTFAELGVPWARRTQDQVWVKARVDGSEVAVYRDGAGTIATSSARPYLHPLRTLAGVVLTAQHPADHDWHLGVGLAVPDVNGVSFWGGGTYVPGQGYVLLDNHGRIEGETPEVENEGFTQRLRWLDTDRSVLLTERRSTGWTGLDSRTWRLSFESTLSAEVPIEIGSPGSKGREAAGYGGFFWRFPSCADVDVCTAQARGEAAVNGSVAPWVAWTGDFLAGPGVCGPATIVVAASESAAAQEPWFVRVESYPGLGSALAWDHPRLLAAGDALTRGFQVGIVDGRLTEVEIAALASELTGDR